jgi:hypothetical protein
MPVAATCDARCSVCLGNDHPGLQNVQTTTGGIGIVAAVGHCVCKLGCVAFGFHCTCPDESGNKILRPVSDLEGNASKQLHISGQSWRSFPLKHSGPELEEAEVWMQLPCEYCLTSTGSLQCCGLRADGDGMPLATDCKTAAKGNEHLLGLKPCHGVIINMLLGCRPSFDNAEAEEVSPC